MSSAAVTSADLDRIVAALRQRREALVRKAPVFWRPAADADRHHRAFLARLIADSRAKAYRTEHSVLVAVPRGRGWLVDDLHVPGTLRVSEGRDLWNAFVGEAAGATVRFVCPTHELERARFARAADLELDESWAARPSW